MTSSSPPGGVAPLPAAQSRTILTNLMTLGSGEIAARIVAFLATTYLTRQLGPAGFGIVGLATALCGYFALAVTAGFNDVGAREVAQNASRSRAIAAGATLVRLLVATAAFALISLVAWLLPKAPVVKIVVVLTGLTFFSLALDTAWVYKGLERTRRVGLALVLGQLLYVAAIFITVRSPGDVGWVPVSQFAGELGAAALLLIPLFKGRTVVPDIREGFKILWMSRHVTLTRLLRTIIYTFDVMLIALMLTERDVGLYSAAYRFCFLLVAVAVSLHVAYLPSLARDAAAGRDVSAGAQRSLHLAVVIAVPSVTGGCLLAGPLLTNTFGGAYGDAAAAFSLLLLSIGFVFVFGTVHNILVVLHRTKPEMWIIAVGAALNAALNFLMIPRFGILGAALTTVLSEGVILALGLWLVARTGVRLQMTPLIRPMVAAAVMSAGILALGPERLLAVHLIGGALLYIAVLALINGVPEDILRGLSHRASPLNLEDDA